MQPTMQQLQLLTMAAPFLLLQFRRRASSHGRVPPRCRGLCSTALEGYDAPTPPPPLPQDYYAPMAAAGRRPPLLLDVGAAEAFRRGHVKGAAAFPLADLAARLYELPPPHEAPLSVGGPSAVDVRIALDILQAAGWRCRVAYQDHGPDRAMYLLQQRREGDGGAAAAEIVGLGVGEPLPLPHLRPNPFLQMVSEEVIDWAEAPAASLLVDLGCGGGRDAACLGLTLQEHQQHQQQEPGGGTVLAIDNHHDALRRAAALAARAGLPAVVEAAGRRRQHERCARVGAIAVGQAPVTVRCLDMDLRAPSAAVAIEAAAAASGGGRPWLVHAARFLERRLLRWLSGPDAVAPGGWVVWATFMEGPKGRRNAVPPFRTGRLLGGKDELVSYFRDHYDIAHAAEGQLVTRGVATPAAFVAARRRRT